MDEQLIQRTFELALKGAGFVSPNPLVGAVIVKNGKIIAEGFHKGPGLDHAEIDAFKNATESLEGATLYCNLEPCCHSGKKTPPCVPRIIEKKIKKVVVCNVDPNPAVAGEGLRLLKTAGIEVVSGVLEEEGKKLNETFFYHIVNKLPFVHLKWAQSLDGRLTCKDESQWITGAESRAHVHLQRMHYDAILVGTQTVIKDNPSLTVRDGERVLKCPKRIILGKSSLSPWSKVLTDEYKTQTMQIQSLDLKSLYEQGICSIWVEGGAKTISYFLEKNLGQKVSVYIAPKIFGKGEELKFNPWGQLNQLENLKGHWTSLGPDQLFQANL